MTDTCSIPRFLIAAAHKSSGKTVVSTGLAAALTGAGTTVQCFKKGPDYIDPMWLAAASGRPCYNLDFNTMEMDERATLLGSRSGTADLALVEANKGLFDGVAADGNDSNAELAKQLGLPVILVIDTVGITRGVAPLLMGYQAFDRDVNIAGIILNKTGGTRHEAKLRTAVETYTDMTVLGAVGRDDRLNIGERHLGLTTPGETGQLARMIADFGEIVGGSVELDSLRDIATEAPGLDFPCLEQQPASYDGLRIGIARDVSFGFYYADDLEAMEALGATLVPFDTASASSLPDIDGLFIGGGFPEMAMDALSGNRALRKDIKLKIEAGLPTYAECGGLMYLCEKLEWADETANMCGVIAAKAVMNARPQGRGYARFSQTDEHLWGAAASGLQAHEFHYAHLEGLPTSTKFARKITRGHGTDGNHDGVVKHNLLAGFVHLRNTRATPWVGEFLKFVAKIKVTK